MATDLSDTAVLTPQQLVDALDTLGVHFLRGGLGAHVRAGPAALLAGLAASAGARLRLALIPLLLARPEFAHDAGSALQQMSPAAAVTFRCYYTAACWLQVKHRGRLTACLGPVRPLPDLFGEELGLAAYTDPDAALRALGAKQQVLSGRALNWCGSYEHAARTWLRQRDRLLLPKDLTQGCVGTLVHSSSTFGANRCIRTTMPQLL